MDTRTDPLINRYCSRPWKQATFLSDGTAVCACIDVARTNPLGNIHDRSFDEVWDGFEYARLRGAIASGNIDLVPICRGCPNRISTPPEDRESLTGNPRPKVLFLESVAACNLACPGCNRDAIEGNRDGKLVMDWGAYQKVIDALSPDLEYMEYHLGGENFMHKQWPRMIRYAKDNNPRLRMLSSTNGHYFRNERERQDAVDCGIDGLIFSIDGATPETYAKYRVGGSFDAVIENMKGVLDLRNKVGSRTQSGRRTPFIIWRYILFAWNDSKEEMDLARRMARDLGVDMFAWHLNIAEPEVSSKKYYIGSPHLPEIAHELWDNLQEKCLPDMGWIPYGVTTAPATGAAIPSTRRD
jgi:pyruvate-formate lyase-activating enzyme